MQKVINAFFQLEHMEKTYTVKARIHYGSKSLDLTIPSDIVKEYNVKPGDIFKIETEDKSSNIILKYERVFES